MSQTATFLERTFFIGMDIINAGDFVITNVEGKTCMSFQIPSVRRIDFVKEIFMARATRGKRKEKKTDAGQNNWNCNNA